MITKNKIMAMAASLLLVATSGMAQNATKAPAAGQTKSATKAPAAKAPAKAPTKSMSGTISSADASKLVLSHKAGTKNEDVTFMLGPSTTKTGDMAPGSKATVKYHVESGQNMATSVAATAAKPAASKAPAATTKSKTAPSTKTKLQ
jgi:hypothetical protein